MVSNCRGRAIKLFCPCTVKLLSFVAHEESRLDVGTIARSFGLDPTTVKFNGHFVSRGSDFISSLSWKSLVSFFGSRGFSTGSNDHDAIIVDGKLSKFGIQGLQNPSDNSMENHTSDEEKGLNSKRKTSPEDLRGVNILKKSKMVGCSSDFSGTGSSPLIRPTEPACNTPNTHFIMSFIGANRKRPREEEMVLTTPCKRTR